mgnify:CR=1 FL=1
MIRDIDGNFFLFGGSTSKMLDDRTKQDKWVRNNNRIYKYDKNNNSWIDINVELPLVDWPQDIYNMQGYLRHDHKIILFNSVHNGTALGLQKALIFDPKDNSIKVETLSTSMLIPFRNNIVLKNGSIVRISSKEVDPQRSYVYLTDNSFAGNTPIKSDGGVRHLVVATGTLVEIEDPYKYESITIEGSGKLKWFGPNMVREFTSKDKIVTRNTTVDKVDFDRLGYESIFVLDGVNFTISE